MPLIHSSSDKAFKENVRTLMHEVGSSPHVQSPKQALAIAFSEQRRSRAQGGGTEDYGNALISGFGGVSNNDIDSTIGEIDAERQLASSSGSGGNYALGGTPGFAFGGMPSFNTQNVGFHPPIKPLNNPNANFLQRQQERNLMHTGPIHSIVPGRTDNHFTSVPSGSYILPAQHIASMGHGNSNAGLAIANSMFAKYTGPKGRGLPPAPKPAPGALQLSAQGGDIGGGRGDENEHVPVDVALSGGEFIVSPEAVRIIGKGSIKNGHRILDKWVMDTRKKEIETQKKLPPPVKR